MLGRVVRGEPHLVQGDQMDPTLLIIDDSRLARNMIRTFAEAAVPGLQVLEAGDGDAGLDLVASLPGLTHCTVDYTMPGPHGVDLAMRIWERFPAARIALVTANIQEAVRRRAETAALTFIAKPIKQPDIARFMVG